MPIVLVLGQLGLVWSFVLGGSRQGQGISLPPLCLRSTRTRGQLLPAAPVAQAPLSAIRFGGVDGVRRDIQTGRQTVGQIALIII